VPPQAASSSTPQASAAARTPRPLTPVDVTAGRSAMIVASWLVLRLFMASSTS
jgi:hypothetical protein